jgi:hypothetical protein
MAMPTLKRSQSSEASRGCATSVAARPVRQRHERDERQERGSATSAAAPAAAQQSHEREAPVLPFVQAAPSNFVVCFSGTSCARIVHADILVRVPV